MTPCRIQVVYVQDTDEPYYQPYCVCGVRIPEQRMPAESLEAAYEHFVNYPHTGYMFIDFCVDARELDRPHE